MIFSPILHCNISQWNCLLLQLWILHFLYQIGTVLSLQVTSHSAPSSVCILTIHTQHVSSMSNSTSIRHSQPDTRSIFIPCCYMTIKYYRQVTPKNRVQTLGSSYAYKLVTNIFANFLYAFSQQFMKSSMSWDMFGKIFVFLFLN